jgi:hypothetical protein
MKRLGFVSNSSSSSFAIQKKDLHPLQIAAIKNYWVVADWLGMDYVDAGWSIRWDGDEVSGYTYMDNFDMFAFLELIGVTKVEKDWEE